MKTHLIVLASLLFLLPVLLQAENYQGTVISTDTDQPIPGVTILVEQDDFFFYTDNQGNFSFSSSKSPVSITVSHVGYASKSGQVMVIDEINIIYLAQELTSLDNIVVTTNRYSREAYKTTQPINVVGSQEIETSGKTIVSDIIRDFPGVDMNDTGPFRARPVIRGLYGTRILVLVDGERLNDQRDISSFAGVSMSLVDVNEIDRIEVVNGPSSVLYGSDAMAGVVNIITKTGRFTPEWEPQMAYSGRYSTAGELHMNRFDLGFSSSRLTGSFGFMYRKAEKDFQPPDGWDQQTGFHAFNSDFYKDLNDRLGTTYGVDGLANTRAEISNVDGKLAYKLSDKYRLDFDMGIYRAEDIGYPGVPNDSTPFLFFYPNHNRDNFALTFTGNNLTDKMSRMTGRLYYEKLSKDFLTDFLGSLVIYAGPPPFAPTITPLSSLTQTEVKKLGLNFQEIYTVKENSQLTFGFDFFNESIDGTVTSITHYEGFGPIPYDETIVGASVPKNQWNSLGVYFSGETEFDNMLATLGIRYDNFWANTEETDGYIDDDGKKLPTDDEHYSSFNGSFGLTLPVSETVNLVGNVGTAYRVPNVVERFFYGSASNRETRPNPDIKPEKSVSFDFGVKAIHEVINYSIMGFYNDYTDFTQLQNYDSLAGHGSFTPLWRYENVEDVSIWGIEAIVEANLEGGLQSQLTISYQKGENSTIDQPLFVSPLKVAATMGYRHTKSNMFGSFTVRMVGDQDRVPNIATLDDIPTRGYWRLDAVVGIDITTNVRFSIAGNNLTDKLYSEPFNARNPDNPVPEPGRNLVFSINASL